MTSEYRRLRRAQEYSGRRELGWLGPDEIAFLEEELRREESANLGADMSGYDQGNNCLEHLRALPLPLLLPPADFHVICCPELEPPPDMLDEDADLYAQFEHAQAQAQAQPGADELNMVNELDVDWDDAEMDLL